MLWLWFFLENETIPNSTEQQDADRASDTLCVHRVGSDGRYCWLKFVRPEQLKKELLASLTRSTRGKSSSNCGWLLLRDLKDLEH